MNEDKMIERITKFLNANFPQIKMHGGEHDIEHLDVENGEVHINLSGACSGCGISPMTIQALKKRLPKEIPEITTVKATTGDGSGSEMNLPSFPEERQEDSVPF